MPQLENFESNKQEYKILNTYVLCRAFIFITSWTNCRIKCRIIFSNLKRKRIIFSSSDLRDFKSKMAGISWQLLSGKSGIKF